MKITNQFKVISFFLLTAYLLSACAGAPTAVPATSTDSPLAHPVTYIGVIENIVADQWTINGVTVTVDPVVVRGGLFNVGDQVKVEGVVNQDGSVTVSLVETPSQDDLSTLPSLGNDNDANTNDTNNNDDNGNDDNGNDANGNDSNSNDDNGNNNDNEDTNSNDDDSNTNDSNDNDNDDNDNNSGSNSNDDDDNDDNGNDDDSDDDNNND